jgi:hypothetical protein
LKAAQKTLEQSTHRGVHDYANTVGLERTKHTAQQIMYRHIRASIYTETLFSTVKFLKKNTCAQIFVTIFHWTRIYPMQAEAHIMLDKLHQNIGDFHTIIHNNVLELPEGELRHKAVHAGLKNRPIEFYMHNQNLAKSGIKEFLTYVSKGYDSNEYATHPMGSLSISDG